MRDTITSLLSSLRGYWKQVSLVALFLFTRTMILYMPPEHSDLPRYWHATLGPGGQPSLQNLASFEYPPLAFAFVNVPRLFHDTQDTYKRSFRALSLAIDILTFGLLACRLSALPLLGYVLGTALLGPVLLDRLDIVLSLCIAIVFFEISAARLPRMALLYTVLGIGTAFKIVPAFGLPALFCYDLSQRGFRRACPGLLVFLAASGLPMLLAYTFVGTGAFYFLTYHAEL